MMIKIACIYKIQNLKENKFYLGSSKNYEKRKMRHLNDLINNKHHNIYLQRAWNKYDKENFIFEILEIINDVENIKKIEQLYLDKLDYTVSYNLSSYASGGDLMSNHPNKKEIIEKRSNTIRNNTKEGKKKKVTIFGDKNPNWKGGSKKCKCGKKITKYNNTCMGCRNTNGKNNPFYGKKHTKENIEIMKEKLINNPKVGFHNSKKCIINEIEYQSFSDAGKALNLSWAVVRYRVHSKNKKFDNYKIVI